MKKILMTLMTGFVSMTSWSACTYNFDASINQVNTMQGISAPNITLFPQISNNKVSLNLLTGMPAGSKGDFRANFASSSSFANNMIAFNNGTGTTVGDKSLPLSGIVAIEFSYKVPDELNQQGLLATFPVAASGNMENGKIFSILSMYGNNSDATGGDLKNGFKFSIGSNGMTQVDLDNLNGATVTNPAQFQKIGFYINQASNQIGLIVNGVNHGYVYTLPSKAKNIGFMLHALHQNIDSSDVNKVFSIEANTDASKITQNYPTGTTDICGTPL